MLNRFSLKPVAATLVVSALLSGSVLADDNIKEEVMVTSGRQITPQDEAVISSAAIKVLRHIAEARGELQGDEPNTDKAKAELDQSERLLNIIQAALPTTKIKDRIWVAKKHLEYENTREVLPDLVPIYASLGELVDYMPTAQAKTHLDQAKQGLEKGDKEKAKEQLQAVDDALLYVEVDLPLNSTRQLLAQAKAQLAKGDAKAADQTLIATEGNVQFISVSFQSPLTDAKAALWRARQDYELGKKDYAKADLGKAVKYLQHAAQSDDKIVRQAAEKLVADVRALHELIEVGDKDFSSRFESAWHRIEALSERSAEYISTGWERLRAEDVTKRDLIEAKLQLAYARIDHLYSQDDATAEVELAEAQGYLDTAAGQAKPEMKVKIEEISALVGGLDKALKKDEMTSSNATAFHTAEARLGTLIQQL